MKEFGPINTSIQVLDGNSIISETQMSRIQSHRSRLPCSPIGWDSAQHRTEVDSQKRRGYPCPFPCSQLPWPIYRKFLASPGCPQVYPPVSLLLLR